MRNLKEREKKKKPSQLTVYLIGFLYHDVFPAASSTQSFKVIITGIYSGWKMLKKYTEERARSRNRRVEEKSRAQEGVVED